jgi:hypothetical protein
MKQVEVKNEREERPLDRCVSDACCSQLQPRKQMLKAHSTLFTRQVCCYASVLSQSECDDQSQKNLCLARLDAVTAALSRCVAQSTPTYRGYKASVQSAKANKRQRARESKRAQQRAKQTRERREEKAENGAVAGSEACVVMVLAGALERSAK